jgi:hypothetical protein
MPKKPWKEMSCGNCGESKHRIKVQMNNGEHGCPVMDIAAVCCGCGSVTHIVPIVGLMMEWGNKEEGERDDGVLAPMDWPREGGKLK